MGALVRSGLLAALLLPVAAAQQLAGPAQARAILAGARAGPLDCQVAAIRPFLNFALRIQAGYLFRLPLDAYSGPGHSVTALTAITAKGASQPVYPIDRLRLPPVLRRDADGNATGTYFLGEGSYRVDWLLVDEAGRTCRKQWFVDTAAGRGVKPAMAPGTVADATLKSSPGTSPAQPASARRITILLDAAPLAVPTGRYPSNSAPSVSLGGSGRGGTAESARPRRIAPLPVTVVGTTLHPGDQVILLKALSALMERLPAWAVRLVVFNLDQQKELYRNDDFQSGFLGDVARTLNQLQLAKVEYRVLQNRMGHIDLLARLINGELSAGPASDAVVFLGPRERFHDKFPDGLIQPRDGTAPKFYFLAYRLPSPLRGAAHAGERDASFGGADIGDDRAADHALRRSSDVIVTTSPEGMPDTLSRAIAKVKGRTMTIETPQQFARAVEEIARHTGK